ncbi:MAG: hypothetical protein ACOYVK_18995 [Bacillota bacterium]
MLKMDINNEKKECTITGSGMLNNSDLRGLWNQYNELLKTTDLKEYDLVVDAQDVKIPIFSKHKMMNLLDTVQFQHIFVVVKDKQQAENQLKNFNQDLYRKITFIVE